MSQGVLGKDCVEVIRRTYGVVGTSWTSIRHTRIVSVQDVREVTSAAARHAAARHAESSTCASAIKISEENDVG